jgi:hypothetical protein
LQGIAASYVESKAKLKLPGFDGQPSKGLNNPGEAFDRRAEAI